MTQQDDDTREVIQFLDELLELKAQGRVDVEVDDEGQPRFWPTGAGVDALASPERDREREEERDRGAA